MTTIRTAIADKARPEHLNRPGHVFPIRARPGGVLERPGHTEATVDLLKIAGLSPFGVLCELTNPDGSMARLAQVQAFGRESGYPWLTVADIVAWRESISLREEPEPSAPEAISEEEDFQSRIFDLDRSYIVPN